MSSGNKAFDVREKTHKDKNLSKKKTCTVKLHLEIAV